MRADSMLLSFLFIVLMMIPAAVMAILLLREVQEPPVPIFQDKTAYSSIGKGLSYTEDSSTVGDLATGLFFIDELTPYPRAIVIDDYQIIKLDNRFVANAKKAATIVATNPIYGVHGRESNKIEYMEFVDDNLVSDEFGNKLPAHIHVITSRAEAR